MDDVPICAESECSKPCHAERATKRQRAYFRRHCTEHYHLRLGYHTTRLGDSHATSEGYIIVRTEKGWEPEHRLKMAAILGRPLGPHESVHHKNGDRADNSPENLELWLGGIRFGQRATEVFCPHCSEPYMKPAPPV